MNDKQKADIIYNILSSQRFADWFEDGSFGQHIRGDVLPPISKEEILEEIAHIFVKKLDK